MKSDVSAVSVNDATPKTCRCDPPHQLAFESKASMLYLVVMTPSHLRKLASRCIVIHNLCPAPTQTILSSWCPSSHQIRQNTTTIKTTCISPPALSRAVWRSRTREPRGDCLFLHQELWRDLLCHAEGETTTDGGHVPGPRPE